MKTYTPSINKWQMVGVLTMWGGNNSRHSGWLIEKWKASQYSILSFPFIIHDPKSSLVNKWIIVLLLKNLHILELNLLTSFQPNGRWNL